MRRSFHGSYVVRIEDHGDYGTAAFKIASWLGEGAPLHNHITRRITADEVVAAARCFAEVGPVSPEADDYLQNDGTTVLMEAATSDGYRATHFGIDEPDACFRLLIRLTTIEFDPFA